MNFFGHAMIAERYEATRGAFRAEFVLGAMLPDFASMLRVRPPRALLPEVNAGLRFHHLTDDAFHGARSFLEISGEASRFLMSQGLSRGSARAVAHVGVELLLDAAFVSKRANEAYLSAITCALTTRVAEQLSWATLDGSIRFDELCQHLRRRGALPTQIAPEVIAERLRNILADRPRLTLDDAGQSVVRDWATRVGPSILSGAPLLLQEVEQRLASSFER